MATHHFCVAIVHFIVKYFRNDFNYNSCNIDKIKHSISKLANSIFLLIIMKKIIPQNHVHVQLETISNLHICCLHKDFAGLFKLRLH